MGATTGGRGMGIKLLIVDDHGILREGLRLLFENQPDLQVVAEAESGRAAVELAKKHCPDVVIMDVSMPGLNGIEATKLICSANPSAKVIGLSVHLNKKYILGMLRAGASGYLLKSCSWEEIVKAVHVVIENRIYLSEGIDEILIKDYMELLSKEDTSVYSILSDRECEVLQLLAEGKTCKEIAFTLNLSSKTVDVFRFKIMKKLGLSSIAELTKYAVREGLTSLEQ